MKSPVFWYKLAEVNDLAGVFEEHLARLEKVVLAWINIVSSQVDYRVFWYKPVNIWLTHLFSVQNHGITLESR